MADYFEKSRHDISITDPSTADVLGFCLARKKDQAGNLVPAWAEFDGKYLADQFFTDAATQANLDPEKELLLGQSDWRSGFGLSIYDPNDPKRYEESIGADLRIKDRARLSYGVTSLTYPTNVVYNADMENNRDWTNGAQSAVQAHAGTYSWAVTNGAAAAYQDLPWSATYQSCEYTFTCWVWASGAGGATNVRIGINDGVGTTYSTAHAGNSAWAQLSVVRTLDASATRLRLLFDNADSGVTGYFDDAAIDGTTVDTLLSSRLTKCFSDFNGHIYIGIGRDLCKINGTTGAFTWVKDCATTITDLEPMTISGTDYLFIAQGLSTAYEYITTAEARTVSNAAASYYQYLQVVYTTATTMYGNDTNSTIRSTTNPLNGGTAWSATTQVDNDSWDILDLFTQSGALYIRKEDKPYYLSAAGAVQNDLAPETVTLAANTSDRAQIVWNGEIFYGCGVSSFIRIGTTNEWISPSDYCANLSAFTGRIFSVAADNRYVFIAVDNSTKVEILCGRDETVDGTTSWVWHPYQEVTMTGCEIMHTTSLYKKRLYIASDTAGEAIQYIPLPTSYGNITSDSDRSFLTGGYFTTPNLHGNFKETTKGLISVTSSLGHAYDADIYWTISYKKLGDTSWTSLGNAVGTATDRTHTLYRTTSTTSPMFQFKFAGVTDTTNTSPELLSYTAKLIMYPTIRKLILCTVRVGDGVTDKNGLTMSNKTTLQKTCLNNARSATWLVSFTDIDGTSAKCKFLPLPSGTPRRVPVKDEKGRTIEWEYNLLLMEVATS